MQAAGLRAAAPPECSVFRCFEKRSKALALRRRNSPRMDRRTCRSRSHAGRGRAGYHEWYILTPTFRGERCALQRTGIDIRQGSSYGAEDAAPAVALPVAAGGHADRRGVPGRAADGQVTLRWFSRDLNSRGALVANALSDSITDALVSAHTARLRPLFDRAAQDERLFAHGALRPGRTAAAVSTDRFPDSLTCAHPCSWREAEPRLALAGGAVHVGVQDIMGVAPPPPAPARVEPGMARIRRARHRSSAGRADPGAGPMLFGTAGPAARPELHRAPQPGHAALPDRPDRGAGRGDRPHHRGGRAAELARLGQRCARADARRRPGQPAAASRRNWRPLPPTFVPACAIWKTSTADRRARMRSGPPSGCARCCAPS